jgi:hypothetical protein
LNKKIDLKLLKLLEVWLFGVPGIVVFLRDESMDLKLLWRRRRILGRVFGCSDAGGGTTFVKCTQHAHNAMVTTVNGTATAAKSHAFRETFI